MDFNGFDINPQQGAAGTYGVGICPTSINEGIDREIQVDAVCGDKADTLTLVHEGMRQAYITADGDVWMTADDEIYGVLKGNKPYTELEYIDSDGKQWIDTGFTFDYTKDTVYSAEAMALSDGRTIIMGSYYDGNYRCMAIEFGGTSNSHVGAGRGYIMLKKNAALDMWASNKDINVKRSISLSFTASKRTAVLDFDGEQKTGTASSGTLSAKGTTRMFIDLRASNLNMIQYPLRMYNAQIKQSGELVRDFIPVLDLNGVACMYDKVSKTFFYNQGSGSFVAGNKK